MGTLRVIQQRTTNSAKRKLWPIFKTKPTNIVVACMPKSGSTYISQLLMEAGRLPKVGLADWGDFGEQFLSKRLLKQKIGSQPGSVCHIHLRGTPNTQQLLTQYDLKPIIIVRNIFDIVPSIADHWHREKTIGFGSYVPQDFKEMDREALHDFIIVNCLPWYFAFLMSWHEASEKIATHWISYEDFFADQASQLKAMLDFTGIAYSDDSIQQSIEARKTKWSRLNKGVAGRGESLLLPRQKQLVREIANTWAKDHSRYALIGLD